VVFGNNAKTREADLGKHGRKPGMRRCPSSPPLTFSSRIADDLAVDY
jgi:hypothetical protein